MYLLIIFIYFIVLFLLFLEEYKLYELDNPPQTSLQMINSKTKIDFFEKEFIFTTHFFRFRQLHNELK